MITARRMLAVTAVTLALAGCSSPKPEAWEGDKSFAEETCHLPQDSLKYVGNDSYDDYGTMWQFETKGGEKVLMQDHAPGAVRCHG